MGQFITSEGGKDAAYIKEIVVDEEQDVQEVSTKYTVGSKIIVISTGNVYMLNTQKQWTLFGGES